MNGVVFFMVGMGVWFFFFSKLAQRLDAVF